MYGVWYKKERWAPYYSFLCVLRNNNFELSEILREGTIQTPERRQMFGVLFNFLITLHL